MISLLDPNLDRPVKNNLAKFREAELEYWYEQKRKCAREWDASGANHSQHGGLGKQQMVFSASVSWQPYPRGFQK